MTVLIIAPRFSWSSSFTSLKLPGWNRKKFAHYFPPFNKLTVYFLFNDILIYICNLLWTRQICNKQFNVLDFFTFICFIQQGWYTLINMAVNVPELSKKTENCYKEFCFTTKDWCSDTPNLRVQKLNLLETNLFTVKMWIN